MALAFLGLCLEHRQRVGHSFDESMGGRYVPPMPKDKQSTRELVERMIKADNRVTAAEIARKAGVSRERVRQILEELGYELDQVWRKRG